MRAGLSDHMRIQLTERILANEKAFEAPAPAASMVTTQSVNAEGALMMERFVVKSFVPHRDEVELRPPPIRFHPVERIEKKRNVLSATLFRFLDGSGSFNMIVVNAAGSGVDHARQFTRVEFEFSIMW